MTRWTPAEVALARRYRARGWDYQRIGAKLGRSWKAVWNHVSSAPTARKHDERTTACGHAIDHDCVLALWAAGMDGRRITRAMKLTRPETVHKIVIRARWNLDQRAVRRKLTQLPMRWGDRP